MFHPLYSRDASVIAFSVSALVFKRVVNAPLINCWQIFRTIIAERGYERIGESGELFPIIPLSNVHHKFYLAQLGATITTMRPQIYGTAVVLHPVDVELTVP